MQKSGIFKNIKIAIKNVGLCAAMSLFLAPGNVLAVSQLYPECADCYRCTNVASTGGCAGSCVYDENYCTYLECEVGKVWNSKTQQCECENACIGIQDPVTCECSPEEIVCEAGDYVDNSGLLPECKACPEGNFNLLSTFALESLDIQKPTVTAGCGLNTDNDGANGITDCYYGAVDHVDLTEGVVYCNYADNTGSFVWTQNCFYSN